MAHGGENYRSFASTHGRLTVVAVRRICHHVLAVVGLVTLAALAFSGAAGAADPELPPDIALRQRPLSMEYDATTDQFLVRYESEDFAQCGRGRLHIIDRAGNERWHVPAPVPCHWTMHDGTLFVASDDIIRSFDLTTGELNHTWTTPRNVEARELFIGGDFLWFNHEAYRSDDLFTWFPESVGALSPTSDDEPSLRVHDNAQIVASSADGRYQWLTDNGGLTRFDHDGPTNELVMPRNDNISPHMFHDFVLTEDEQLLYAVGTEVLLFDANTLEQLGRHDGDPYRLFEQPNGSMVGTRSSGSEPVVVFAPRTVNPIATGPVLGDSPAWDGAVVGDHLALVLDRSVDNTADYRLTYFELAPVLSRPPVAESSGSLVINADNPRTVLMQVHFANAVQTITIGDRPVSFTPLPSSGRTEWLAVDVPALPAGRHRIIFDGPLGTSPDVAANYLDIAAAQPRSEVEVLVRADSAAGEAEMWISCRNGEFGDIDISEKVLMRAGSRLTFHPVIGHECSVQFSRQNPQGGQFANNWRHLTTGFYSVESDPNASNMLDVDDWSRQFTVDERTTGVAAYLVEYDQTVVWTYSYGFGGPPGTDRSPISLQCADETTTYRTYLGYWYRSIIDRNQCTITHTPSPGAEFSGFSTIEPDGAGLSFRRTDTLELGSGEAAHVVVVYDIYPHPSEHNGAFARQQYLDFLGRPGDAGGLRFWEDALNSGSRGRTDLVRLFLDSPEFGGTVAPVNRLYSAYFDRAPDRDGLFFWVNWIRDGRTLGQVSDEFARSPEFNATYGSLSDEAFIDLVYTNVLGRPADAAGRAFWVDEMADGLTRGQLMSNFSESPEYIEQTRAAVLVESLYQGLLQRSPDPEGFAFWTGQVEAGASIDNLVAGMLASDEYFNRFDNIIDELPRDGASRVFAQTEAPHFNQAAPPG